MFETFVLKVKRKEGRFYALLNGTAKGFLAFNMPVVKPLHYGLYLADRFVRTAFWHTIQVLWVVPLFKARCEEAGKNLRLPDGMPYVAGSHLKIFLGDNVTIMRSTIGASKLFDSPVLRIGNNSTIGYGTVISVAKEIFIGDNCMISPNCMIMDSDDHPLNPQKRLAGEPVDKDKVVPVKIGNNVWIGSYCAVFKGVTIGENTVVSAHSVITRDALPNCVYAGHPARPTLRDIDRQEQGGKDSA